MIELITSREKGRFTALLESMHADRKRVFVDLYGWELPTKGDLEADRFDDERAEYLVLPDEPAGTHRASIRLLRTERPHLMTELFEHLCEGEIPRGPNVREITRFCIAPRGRAAARIGARNMLARALIEYGELAGVTGYTAVCHMGLLQQVLSAGWACRPLGMPQLFAGEMVGAFLIEVGPATLRMMSEAWRCDVPALRLATCTNALAA
jgi:acyl-homoserine lactone synthase